ncbi:MAG: conjugal transfer protein TraX [Clostridia bacterium]|nr:conjugal transfer protein TraX [Clostridia bacterium]
MDNAIETSGGKRGFSLNGNQLKLIAILAMTVDHLTWTLFPGYQHVAWIICIHIIGRLTAPIMWFFIAEGCFYTHDRKRYLIRLFAFALISHFAYDFAFGIPFFSPSAGMFNRTSVMWSLALGASVIFITQSEKIPTVWKYVCALGACVLAFPSDWSSVAVMAPAYLYSHRGNIKKQAFDIVFWTFIYAAVYFFFLDKVYGLLQLFTCLSVPLLACYNGQRGKNKSMKWFFYYYYPAHLAALGVLRLLLHGNVPTIF